MRFSTHGIISFGFLPTQVPNRQWMFNTQGAVAVVHHFLDMLFEVLVRGFSCFVRVVVSLSSCQLCLDWSQFWDSFPETNDIRQPTTDAEVNCEVKPDFFSFFDLKGLTDPMAMRENHFSRGTALLRNAALAVQISWFTDYLIGTTFGRNCENTTWSNWAVCSYPTCTTGFLNAKTMVAFLAPTFENCENMARNSEILECLRTLAVERLCLSCWMHVVMPYLDRWGFGLEQKREKNSANHVAK